MPAPRSRNGEAGSGLVDQLNASVEKLGANNFLSVDKYYRSASLLLRQAGQYRVQHNQEQLYVMLLRFVSLVVETLPQHQRFRKNDSDYQELRRKALLEVMPELERLAVDLRVKGATADLEAEPFAPTKTAGTTLLQAGNLPELSWASSLSPPAAAGAALGVPQPDGFDLLAAPPDSSSSSSSSTALAAPLAPSLVSLMPELGTSIRLPAASQATLSKHAVLPLGLMSSSSSSDRAVSSSRLAQDLQQQRRQQVQYPRLELPSSVEPPQAVMTSLDAALASLDVGQQQQVVLPQPSPYAELQLGPQEVGVTTAPAPTQPLAPDETCCTPAPQPPEPSSSASGVAEVRKRQSLRDVHVSVALMDEFMRYATSNTRRGIETCALLAGTLSACDSVFTITTLILPKQKGTTDTVEMLNEEEIFEAQDSRSVYPLGWIHTHPSQTCFLSSVDVHTHCWMQTLMGEAVAIVMAPRDPQKSVGIFRLTTPGGLSLVQRCQLRGFHAHPPTETGQPIYELCGHVYVNPRVEFEVVDLR